jgi:hypothetical protein
LLYDDINIAFDNVKVNPIVYDKIKKIQDGPYTEYFESRKNILPTINPD